MAQQISENTQVQLDLKTIGIIVGGGNFFRGAKLNGLRVSRITGDHLGMVATMLNAIAAWSGCDIYANTNDTWTYWYWVTSPYEINKSIWNQNQKEVVWTDIENGNEDGSDRFFEYTTTGSQDYRWILSN